jgi:flagellar motility protein MotE (MotC chaperone)
MKPMPRLLPLVAVAIGGVLALKALSDIPAMPQLFAAARARAEEAPSSAKHASPLPPAAVSAPASVHACAQSPAELAKAAGLSPGELQTLQNLGARRGQIDDRERLLDTQLQLLAAAESKVDSKMKALNSVKAEIQALLGQADQQQQAEIDRLVTVYEKMKPANAAAVFATLDDKVRIPVAAKMKVSALAQILSQMPPADAKKLTESLAHRYSAAETLSEATQTPPQGDPKASPPPTQLAAASPPAGGPQAAGPKSDVAGSKGADSGDEAAKPPIKIHMTVKKPAHHKSFVAHARRDTPTLAAARAVASPAHPPSSRPPQQTAAAIKPAPTPSPAPRAAPPTAAPPVASAPTVG